MNKTKIGLLLTIPLTTFLLPLTSHAGTSQDPFEDTSKINSQVGSEVDTADDVLINIDLDLANVGDFNATTSDINVGSPTVLDDTFSGGGTVMAWIYPKSDGEGSQGRIFDKRQLSTGWILSAINEASGNVALQFFHDWSGTNAQNLTEVSIPINQWSHVAVTYNNSNTTSAIIYLNGEPLSFTTDTTPTGSRTDDSGNDLTLGNRTFADRTWDGFMADLRVYKGDELSQATIQGVAWAGVEPTEDEDGHWKLDGDSNDDSAIVIMAPIRTCLTSQLTPSFTPQEPKPSQKTLLHQHPLLITSNTRLPKNPVAQKQESNSQVMGLHGSTQTMRTLKMTEHIALMPLVIISTFSIAKPFMQIFKV